MKIDRLMTMFIPVALMFMAPRPADASPEQTSQVLKVSEHKRLEASICPDSMNRLAVSNDRITQLFGDEGTFESQNDEGTGQVFLKPTAENGTKSLSLTLITEQGLTQDLTLKPTAKSAATLILTRDLSDQNSGKQQRQGGGDFRDDMPWNVHPQTQGFDVSFGKTLSLPEQVLSILKQAIGGQLATQDDLTTSRENPRADACDLTLTQTWQAGVYTVQAYQLQNITETPLELQEKDFYRPGDLALSLNKRVLPIGEKTMLYVVGRKVGEMGASS
jgi:conjugal transfer pilus assembly protein TraK